MQPSINLSVVSTDSFRGDLCLHETKQHVQLMIEHCSPLGLRSNAAKMLQKMLRIICFVVEQGKPFADSHQCTLTN